MKMFITIIQFQTKINLTKFEMGITCCNKMLFMFQSLFNCEGLIQVCALCINHTCTYLHMLFSLMYTADETEQHK